MIRIPEGEKGERGAEQIFEVIMADNLPKINEAQQTTDAESS